MASQQSRLMPLGEVPCPVPLDLLGSLYRADHEQVREMVSAIPAHARARLAAFCYGKRHMHFLGLRIASTCDELTLVQIAGTAGTVMFSQSRSGAARAEYGEPRPVPTKPKVTLASLPSLHS